ncbi:MAG: hypothetical protein PHN34_07460, partial [Kiritimatiellae bacterium]|nr:hypothetical protein [Kiritimatiellia bacterium]
EIRRETLIKEFTCWLALLLWLAAIFWFRAVRQAVPEPDADERPLPHLASALANLPQTVAAQAGQADGSTPTNQPGETNISSEKPAAPAAPPPPPPQKASETVSVDAPVPDAPEPTQEAVLPSGIPDALAARLADALATGSPSAALRALQADPARFLEKPRLAEFLGSVPEADDMVADYLRSQIGKPLIFERNGKQRTVIPRSVGNGIISVETNGRGIDIAISDLTADEKLRWIERPRSATHNAAYCLALMRSSRREEIPTHAASCPPFVAPLLTEAAKRAAVTAQP